MSSVKYDETAVEESRLSRIMQRLKKEESPKASTPANEAPKKVHKPVAAESRLADPSERWPLPGLAPMTRVKTAFGDVHAIALRKGDMVRTREGEFKPIVWLNRVMLDEVFLSQKTDSNPIRIQQGALGPGLPEADVLVSPRQVVLPTPKANIPQPREAGDLIAKPGVNRQQETGLSYTMFHLGEPEEIMCEGVYLSMAPPS